MTDFGASEETARPATPADLAALVPLVEAAATEKAAQKGGALDRRERRTGPIVEALAHAVDAPDYELAVGVWDGTVVGYALARADRLADGGCWAWSTTSTSTPAPARSASARRS